LLFSINFCPTALLEAPVCACLCLAAGFGVGVAGVGLSWEVAGVWARAGSSKAARAKLPAAVESIFMSVGNDVRY
jgi:hypothetical protein